MKLITFQPLSVIETISKEGIYEPKYKGKDEMSLDYQPKKAICDNCKEEFYLESYKNSRSKLCPECYAKHRRERKTQVMRELRAK